MSSDQRDTDPGNRSAADLEREVDRERGRIDQTIDALQEKLSVGNLVDQVLHSVSDYGGDIGRNVARTARDNPLPLLLTGIGLVWLMTSAGGRRRRDFAHEHEYEPRGRASMHDPDADPAGYDDWSRSATDSVRDTAENLAGAASGAAEATMDAARSARERAGAFVGKAESGARRAGEWAGEAAHRVGEAAHRFGDTAGHAKARAAQAGRATQRGFQTLLEEQPLVLGAIAVAVGAAIGGALPSTRAEDRIMGQHSDRLYRKAKQAAGAVADEARVMAGEAAERFQENAPRWAEQAKEKAEETGARLRDAAESATGVNLDKP